MRAAAAPPRFVLWHEVLFAYLAPALCAGAGGLITRQPELMRAAVTSVAVPSAVVAFLLGMWLQRSGARIGWLRRASPVALAVGFSGGAAGLASAITHVLVCTSWFDERIRIDIPIAAAVASAIVAWRWASIRRKEDQ